VEFERKLEEKKVARLKLNKIKMQELDTKNKDTIMTTEDNYKAPNGRSKPIALAKHEQGITCI